MATKGAGLRSSGRQSLEARAADRERDLDVAASGPRVRTRLVRQLHELDGLVAGNLRGVEVERRGEAEAAGLDGPDPDPRRDA